HPAFGQRWMGRNLREWERYDWNVPQFGYVLAGSNRDHSWRSFRLRDVDPRDAGAWMRRSDESQVQRTLWLDVFDVVAASSQKARIFNATNWPSRCWCHVFPSQGNSNYI